MANLQLPQGQNMDAVLGSEYCSGYIDSLGKWNTGFYCPSIEESVDVFCCGTHTHKYCCTKKDQVLQTEVESVTVMIGVIVGASTALLLLTIVACVCFSWCPLYRKKHHSKNRGAMYRLYNQGGSDHSTNMYSFSNSRATTPLPVHSRHGQAFDLATHSNTRSADTLQLINHGISHSHTLPHSLSHHHSFRVTNTKELDERRYCTLGRVPREQPPPYHILPRSSFLLLPQDTPDLLSGGLMNDDSGLRGGDSGEEDGPPVQQPQHQLHIQQAGQQQQHQLEDAVVDEEEDLYRSTKF